MNIKTVIVDDHPFTRLGIRSLLEANERIEIVGEASDGFEAVACVEELKPDIMIMDITMPQLNGVDATKEILAKNPEVKIIALSIHSGQKFVKEMIKAGAVGYILKEEAPEELMKAIEKVINGDMFLSSSVTRAALKEDKDRYKKNELNVLESKIHKPPTVSEYVVRKTIIKKLEGNIDKPLSLISAGPGYGKSTMISQWLDYTNHLYIWISLDNEHNYFRTFLGYLLTAMDKLFPGHLMESEKLLTEATLPSVKEIANTLINELCKIDQDLILVLDNYHLINQKQVHSLLNILLEFPPPCLHICIVTRYDPPLNIKRLQISGRVTEIRMDDLSFRKEEIEQLFKLASGENLKSELIGQLYEKTEGWIIALHLVSMIRKESGSIDKILESIDGELNIISDYLIEEVLSNQPEYVHDWLMQSSLLNSFCEPLLEEVIDIGNKYVLKSDLKIFNITWLQTFNMFVTPLYGENKWFRYHHLFKEFLQSELKKRKKAGQIEKIHLKASRWFERNGFIEEAIFHAMELKGYDRAVDIILAQRINLLNSGEWQLLNKIYQKIPKGIVEGNLELLFVDAYVSIYLSDHKKVGVAVSLMKPFMSTLVENSLPHGEYNLFLGYKLMSLENDYEASLRCFEIAFKAIPDTVAGPRAMVELLYPVCLQISGKYKTGLKWLEETIAKSGDFAKIRKDRLFSSLFLICTAEADLKLVEYYYLRGIRHARESNIDNSLGALLMMAGQLFMRRGEWQQSIQYFEEVIGLKDNVHTRTLIDCFTSLIVIYCVKGDAVKSMELVKELENITDNLSPYLQRFLWSCKLRYAIIIDDKQTIRNLLGQYRHDYIDIVFWIDLPEITYCRGLIAEGSSASLKKADKELQNLDKIISSQYNNIHQLEIYALQAILLEKQGKIEEAKEKLIESIDLAEPGDIIAFYVEMGKPMKVLIDQMPDEFKEKPLIKKILSSIKEISANQQLEKKRKGASRFIQKDKLDILTRAEIKVLQCVAEGLRNQEIATKLYNSEETIKKHIYHMFQKLEVRNRLSLVAKAQEIGLLDS